ncbi:hypothetical protein VKT23_002571 [Stygiomarasmius scandens]|uniref:RING-14 protein n=1 Tax=Marasmiellus scandens TaxID=2682957 RepID=A0ABR1K4Z8_9AGAR
MHFSKTYAKLLEDLPPELRQNAIQYRQLKKLINQVVLELGSLGLSPQVLQELLEGQESGAARDFGTNVEARDLSPVASSSSSTLEAENGSGTIHPRVVYEFNSKSGKIEPRLRIWVTSPLPDVEPPSTPSSRADSDSEDVEDEGGEHGHGGDVEEGMKPNAGFLWALQQRTRFREETGRITEVTNHDTPSTSAEEPSTSDSSPNNSDGSRELVIPLVKDSAFFQLLSTALQGLSDHFLLLHTEFTDTLHALAKSIGNTARPVSESSSAKFHPHSVLSHPGEITAPIRANKSDLYSWREIFQLYIDAEVFETLNEAHPGQTSTKEAEHRLQLFAERVSQRGLGDRRKLKMKQSRDALETFLGLNMLILNIKKFQEANAEATRKILKKHAKRTALPLPPSNASSPGPLALSLSSHTSSPTYPAPPLDPGITIIGTSVHSFLPRILVQAIGETLLPIIPHIDDYSCVICTSIAFKPIRLGCGHLFCVRCLVKMQKRGQDACPMCRAPNVLRADKSNVDWALLNFMQDWFPLEARAKQKQGEKEAAEEQLREMGFDPSQKCIIM